MQKDESGKLVRTAEKFGLDRVDAQMRSISELRKYIRDARYAYWKGWADILVPILALIVAILAILIK